MRIVCISAAQIPSDTANSIQVMKVCQAFVQLGHDVTLLVPGNQQPAIGDQQLIEHYGLENLFPSSGCLYATAACSRGRPSGVRAAWAQT